MFIGHNTKRRNVGHLWKSFEGEETQIEIQEEAKTARILKEQYRKEENFAGRKLYNSLNDSYRIFSLL
jgi:hypothetical protein